MKKGFTLIELLSVIVILAIIAMIAVPISANIIQNIKKSNFETDVRNSLKSGDYLITNNKLEINNCKPIGEIEISHKDKFISGSICNTNDEPSAKKLCTKDYCAKGDTDHLVISEYDPNYIPKMKYMGDNTYNQDFKADEYQDKIEWIEIGSNSSIETKYATTLPSPRWDLSEKQDGSIMGGLVPIEGKTNYGLVIYGPDGIKANENSSYLFYKMEELKTVYFRNFDTSNVTDMSFMFAYSVALTSLDLSSFNTSNVTDMTGMFHITPSLASINLSSFNTSKVTNMSYMFSAAYALTSLDLSNFNTSNVTDMSSMFVEAIELKNINLSSFNTSKVTNMAGMFLYAYTLTSLDLSNFNTSNVTDMTGMFAYTPAMTKIDVKTGLWNQANATTESMFDSSGVSAVTYNP